MDVNSYRFGSKFLQYLYSPSNSAYNFGTNPFSVEAWVKSFTGGPIVARKAEDGEPSHAGFSLSVSSGNISFMNNNGSDSITFSATGANVTVCDGNWHHVAVVRSGSSVNIYLDGIELPTVPEGDAETPVNVDSDDRLTIGTLDQIKTTLTGYLTEIRVWNEARTVQQILQNFRRRLTPAETNLTESKLVGYWAGEFGVAADFSQTKNQTIITGTNQGSSECPTISRSSPENLCRVFCGIYDCAIKDSDTWKASPQIIVTSQGFVVSDGSAVIQGVQVRGASLSWPATGNSFEATIQLSSWSSNTAYWSTQLNRPVFEGTRKDADQGDTMPYRGSIVFARVGSGVLLNVGTSQFMECISPKLASPVTLCVASEDTTSVQSRDRFCHYDIGGIIHTDSNLALKPENMTANSKILLTHPTLGGNHQSWSMETDGTIVLKALPSLALSAGPPDDNGTRSVIIDDANPTDLNQKWLSLGNSQNVWNGLASDAVLASLGSGSVGVREKADGSPAQSWYIFGSSFICASSALALTVTGAAGTELNLQAWSPDNPNQQFTYFDKEIIHDASGLILVTEGDLTNGKVILANPSTVSPNSQWYLVLGTADRTAASNMVTTTDTRPSRAQMLRRTTRQADTNGSSVLGDFTCGLTAAGLTTYIVYITTSNAWFSGTDDIVKISLGSKYTKKSLPLVELKNSLTHQSDPFERGTQDVFVLSNMDDIGQITEVTFEISRPHWYSFKGDWRVTGVSVSNAKWHTKSLWMAQQLAGLPTVHMPDRITLPMLLEPSATYDCTMALGMAPAQDATGKKFGWDHTWIEVLNKTDGIRTFFDCAGGHGDRGDPSTKLVDMGICNRNRVVRMSTGNDIDTIHPLKEAYGTNRTDGVENASVRCDGKLRWDGQCHQIANRYLWSCVPSTSIDDLPYNKQPRGYGLSVFFFGKYGVNFGTWSIQNNFGYIESDDYLQFLYWLQKLGCAVDFVKGIYPYVQQLQFDLAQASDLQPDGPEVKKFVQALKSSGKGVHDIAIMLNLTDAQVQYLLGETGGSYWPWG